MGAPGFPLRSPDQRSGFPAAGQDVAQVQLSAGVVLVTHLLRRDSTSCGRMVMRRRTSLLRIQR